YSTALMEEIVDYLQTIYITSNRTEPFWLAAREETPRSEWLREKMELWRLRFPDLDDLYDNRIFSLFQYTWVLLSSGYLAKVRFPLEDSIRIEDWQAFGRDLKNQIARHSAMLPSHYELLTHIRTAPPDLSRVLAAAIGR